MHVCMDSFYICMYESYWYVLLDRWFHCLPACDVSLLVCSLSRCMFPQVSKGHNHCPFHVLEPFMHIPWLAALVKPFLPTRKSYLPLRETAVKAIPYDPLLGILHKTVGCLVGNSYQGDPLTCWWVQHYQHSTIVILLTEAEIETPKNLFFHVYSVDRF